MCLLLVSHALFLLFHCLCVRALECPNKNLRCIAMRPLELMMCRLADDAGGGGGVSVSVAAV